ncbi:MAG: four helix bundle protein [Cyclobacteriaceae bacterium]
MTRHNFRQLKIWRTGLDIAKDVYTIVEFFPPAEKYGLTSQIKRSAVSVPSNIAEGASRKSTKEFQHYLDISIGSLFELETQLTLSYELGFIDQKTYSKIETKLVELQKMIYGFSKSLSS